MKIARILIIALITVTGTLIVRKYAYEPIYIASDSMLPTLYKGQHLIMDKLVFRFSRPERGNIIVFASPVGETHESVKRVIAIGGDTIEVRSKEIWLNGEKIYEPYIQHTRPSDILIGDNVGPLSVPEGHLFVLGDNRDNSSDSATWKDPSTGEPMPFLPLSAVTGKIRGIY